MTNPHDDLLSEIESIIRDDDYTAVGKAEMILSYLSMTKGEQRRSLLGILGYEVREGTLLNERSDMWHARPAFSDEGSPCLVLRVLRDSPTTGDTTCA